MLCTRILYRITEYRTQVLFRLLHHIALWSLTSVCTVWRQNKDATFVAQLNYPFNCLFRWFYALYFALATFDVALLDHFSCPQVSFQGLTGRVQFAREGVRSYVKWDLLKLRNLKLDKVSSKVECSNPLSTSRSSRTLLLLFVIVSSNIHISHLLTRKTPPADSLREHFNLPQKDCWNLIFHSHHSRLESGPVPLD